MTQPRFPAIVAFVNKKATISYGDWPADRRATLRLALSQGVGPCRFAQLRERFGPPTDALAGLMEMRRKDVRVASDADAEHALAAAAGAGARLILRGDADYPTRLAETARPPLLLHVIGDIDRLDGRMIAIVGARNASAAARRFAEDLARDLSTAGVGVVSGLARGIDGAAHRGSLEGFPVGVVAGGIDVAYPPEHRDLQAAVADAGALIAESPVGAKPTERHFPRRNRIVAGLAQAVVVIEAAERSGSLITARFAQEENREVMAAPGFPSDPRSAGANRLIRDGALLIRSADDVLEGLPRAAEPPIRRQRPQARPDPAQSEADSQVQPPPQPVENLEVDPIDQVRSALSAAPITVDELSRECQLSASAIAAILLELELGGEVERLPGQRVARR